MARKARNTALRDRLEEAPSRRIAIYIRRSTDEDNQPYSLEAQEAKLRAFVGSQPGDWQIVKIYSDDASGATTDREELQKMLRAGRAGMFDTLVVYRVDRFSRRLRDLVALLDELDEAEVIFRSATAPFDTSTPIGRMLVQLLGVFGVRTRGHHRPRHRRHGAEGGQGPSQRRPAPDRLRHRPQHRELQDRRGR